MQVKSFVLTMGAGVAIGALGAMMLPKSSPGLPRGEGRGEHHQIRGGKSHAVHGKLEPGGAVTGFVTAPFAFWRAV